jgi:hypothetical protein
VSRFAVAALPDERLAAPAAPNRAFWSEPIQVERPALPLWSARIWRESEPEIGRQILSIFDQYFTKSVWINEQPKGYPAIPLPPFRPHSSILFDHSPPRDQHDSHCFTYCVPCAPSCCRRHCVTESGRWRRPVASHEFRYGEACRSSGGQSDDHSGLDDGRGGLELWHVAYT